MNYVTNYFSSEKVTEGLKNGTAPLFDLFINLLVLIYAQRCFK